MMEHVHISTKISKLGTGIPALNLPAGITCRTDAPCKKKCYACKGRFIFNNVKESCMRNLRVWQEDPIRFEKEVAGIAQFAQYFRWHSSGDIVNAEYLQMMVRVAEECRATKFLAFTKQYEIVNAYLNAGNLLPENLSIVYSAWGDFIPENPHNLPMAYVRFKKEKCEIPEYAMECSGYCGECVGGKSCWNMGKGEAVVFNEH